MFSTLYTSLTFPSLPVNFSKLPFGSFGSYLFNYSIFSQRLHYNFVNLHNPTDKSVFAAVCTPRNWGKPFWRRVIPQAPFLNLLMTFQQREAKLPSLKSVREFRKKSLRENTPKRISTVARYAYCGKSEFIEEYSVHSWVSSSEKIFLRTLL